MPRYIIYFARCLLARRGEKESGRSRGFARRIFARCAFKGILSGVASAGSIEIRTRRDLWERAGERAGARRYATRGEEHYRLLLLLLRDSRVSAEIGRNYSSIAISGNQRKNNTSLVFTGRASTAAAAEARGVGCVSRETKCAFDPRGGTVLNQETTRTYTTIKIVFPLLYSAKMREKLTPC